MSSSNMVTNHPPFSRTHSASRPPTPGQNHPLHTRLLGTELQLGFALIVNILQLMVLCLCVPYGGKDAWLLNALEIAAVGLGIYISFAAMFLNYLSLSLERELDLQYVPLCSLPFRPPLPSPPLPHRSSQSRHVTPPSPWQNTGLLVAAARRRRSCAGRWRS